MKNDDGQPMGTQNENPLLDSRMQWLTQKLCLLDEIVDHLKDERAIPMEDGFIKSHNGNRHKLPEDGIYWCR